MGQSDEYREAHPHSEAEYEAPVDLRPELRLPAEIIVLGHRYHVSVIEDPDVALGRTHANDHDALGLTDLNRGYTRIRGGGEQSEDTVRDTMLHETMHMVAYHMGVTLDEDDLGRLATGLLLTLRTNPELLAALISR